MVATLVVFTVRPGSGFLLFFYWAACQ